MQVESKRTQREEKLTFDAIYEDFRRRHPHLRKEAIRFIPSDLLTITIYFDDGVVGVYNYLDHRLKFVQRPF